MKRKERKKSGFTLVEIMIALVVLSLSMMGFVPMIVQTIKSRTFASHMTKASELAQDRLEFIRRMDYSDPMIDVGTSSDGLINNKFTREWTVGLVAGNADIKSISVTVTWNDPWQNSQATTYVTTKVRY